MFLNWRGWRTVADLLWDCWSDLPTFSLFPLCLPPHGFRQIKNVNTRHLKGKGKRDSCVWILQRENEREFMPILEFSYFSSQVTAVLGRQVVLKCGSRTGYPFELPGTGTVLGATQTFWVGISGVWGLANCMVNGPQNGRYEPCIWEPPMQTFCLRMYVVDKECDVNVSFWVRIWFGWTSIF